MFGKILKNEDGAALVLSLIIILVLIVLIGALANSINNNIGFTKRHEDTTKAFYAAEAGIEHGINLITSDHVSLRNNLNDNGFVEINDLSNPIYEKLEGKLFGSNGFTFRSTGESNNIKKVIEASFNFSSGLFPNAIEAEGDLAYGQNITVDGTISAGGEYKPHNNNTELTFINGGEVEPTPREQDFHDKFSNLFPEPEDDEQIEDLIDGSWTYKTSGDFEISDLEGENNEVLFVDGDLTISGNQNIISTKTLLVNGELTIGNNVKVNKDEVNNDIDFIEDNYLTIIVNGDMETGNSFMMQGFIYSLGSITFGNQGNEPYMKGSIYSEENFSVGNPNALAEGDFIYDENAIDNLLNLIDFDDENAKRKLSIVSWQEQ
ncbi:MAG: hypothetical protein D5S01_08475 [Halanaerobium sp. MSAO_Bac5]|nr:MAG: hypothetical protein D5S01_08475 [Halanaerobium sp. MSAO_Bac5]